jgi:4-hydroxythreonine-4-phosphate dehydrogenase
MEMAGFAYPGHTEFLASHFPQQRSLMLMVHDDLRIGVVTGHIALHDVATQITAKNIVEKANVFIKSLKVDFGIDKPKITILGLNPHAGDMGLFGNEEVNVIIPPSMS